MRRIVKTPVKTQQVTREVVEEKSEIVDTEGGYIELLGKVVCIICDSYIYTGLLTGVNETCLELTDAYIVYETGAWKNPMKFQDAQKLPSARTFVSTRKIESCFEVEL
jgi:hypothetical protein